MEIEILTKNKYPERNWGFRQPTVLIESQSAPALRGNPSEQAYMRAFPLASNKDLVVTDFPLDQVYVQKYLGETLEFDLPQFLVIPNKGLQCLSEHILAHPETAKFIKDWTKTNGDQTRIQFFNVTDTEKDLLDTLLLESTNGNIDTTIMLGSKPGFRRFCEAANLPVPKGFICKDLDSSLSVIEELFGEGSEVFIKSEYGTGGAVLKSNVLLTKEELKQKYGGDLKFYVSEKLKSFGDLLGDEWEIEEFVEGEEGSVHVYIKDAISSEDPFVLGQISEENSYVGGFFPVLPTEEVTEMVKLVKEKIIPKYQKLGVYGYHCFDFKGGVFLEDNTRQGALDFIDGTVRRIVETHFPGEPYFWYHKHIPIPKPTSFQEIWQILGDDIDPKKSQNGCFSVVTNPEVLPYGGSLDLTVVVRGLAGSLENAKKHFHNLQAKILTSPNLI